MLNTAQRELHPELAQLRHFRPLGSLDHKKLEQLASKLTIQFARKGAKLLKQGDRDDSTLYLLEGSVLLNAVDGGRQQISADEDSARSPIARLRPSRYDVIAVSNVAYLEIASSLLESGAPTASEIPVYEVVDESDEHQNNTEDQLAFQLYEDLKSNQLLLPSLPDVAIRVGQAVNHDYADANRVARVIENDPVMAAKLIKVANSARYAGRASIGALPEAITRIGLSTTHSLVITFALRELFRCNSPTMYELMRDEWEVARELAAICHILAPKCTKIDPESALLAGLVHNIGSVAIITHARDYAGLSNNIQVLKDVLARLKSQVGKMILRFWEFPPTLVEAATDDPLRTHEGPCDMGDLVVVAQEHIKANGEMSAEPSHADIPAYEKIGISPDAIKEFLDEAETELQEMLSLLGD